MTLDWFGFNGHREQLFGALTGRRLNTRALLGVALCFFASMASGQINPGSPTTGWTPVPNANGNFLDTSGDEQSGGSEADIVGNATQPSLYIRYDSTGSGSLAFR